MNTFDLHRSTFRNYFEIYKNLLFAPICLFLLIFQFDVFGQNTGYFGNKPVPELYTNSPLREGQTLVLMATGGSSCLWSGPNNFTSNEYSVEIKNIDTSNAGVYVLTLYDSIADTYQVISSTVEIYPKLDQFITTDNEIVIIDSAIYLHSSLNDTGYTYTWTTNTNLTIPPGPNPVISTSGLSPSSYPFYISFSLEVAENGKTIGTGTIWIQIIHRPCPPPSPPNGPYSFIHGGLTSNINTALLTPVVYIDGVLTVDNNFDFTFPGSPVKSVCIYPNCLIFIKTGRTLVINNATIYGCEYLHRGFHVLGNGSLVLKNDTIQNGFSAISVSNGGSQQSNLFLENNTFRENYTAIYLNQSSPILTLKGNRFEGTDLNMMPLLNAGTLPSKAFRGLWIIECAQINIANAGIINRFQHLHTGILSYKSNLTISSDATAFNDITVLNNPPSAQAIAIHSYNDDYLDVTKYLLIKNGNNIPNPIDINNSYLGISVSNVNSVLNKNVISNVNTGVRIVGNDYKFDSIVNNTISCNTFGIKIIQGFPFISHFIEGNRINLNGTSTVAGISGISVDGALDLSIRTPIINSNHIYVDYGINGIELNSIKNTQIQENDIHLMQPVFNRNGIVSFNNDYDYVSCNEIIGSGPTLSNPIDGPVAIRIDNTVNGTYRYNTVQDTYVGLQVESPNSNLSINHNNIWSHHYGLYYSPSASTNNQVDKWNHFLGTYNIGALNLGTGQFTVGQGCPNCWPATYTPFFFTQDNGQYSEEEPSCGSNNNGGSQLNKFSNDSIITQYDSNIVLKQLTFTDYPEVSNWSTGRFLYNKLKENNFLLNIDSLMQYFKDSVQSLSIGKFQDFSREIKTNFRLNTVTESYIDSIYKTISINYRHLTLIDSILANDTLLSETERNILLSERLSQFNTAHNYEKQITSAMQGYLEICNNNIDYLLTQNGFLPDTSVFEKNEKLFHDIYLNSFAKGIVSFTQVQKEQLLYLAAQCPLSGGKSVYFARTLYATLSDTSFIDNNICLQVGLIKTTPNSSSVFPNENLRFSLYPNPTSRYLTIECNQIPDNHAIIEFVNILGKIVYSQQTADKSSITILDLANLVDGIYFVRIKYANRLIQIGKISLVK